MLTGDAKTTILLADSTPSILDLEKSFFRRGNYHILSAGCAADVYETALARRPDILFMGLDMEDMPGDELCLRLRAHADLCSVPMVLVIRPNRPGDLLRCERSGCDDVLLKPPRQHQFLKTVEKHLSVPRRAAPRVETRMHVTYRESNGTRDLTDFSINMSTGGVFIETENPLPVDTSLLLEFTIPDGEKPIKCRARVAWINPGDGSGVRRLPRGMGLQFVGLSLDDMAVIRAFVMRSFVVPEW
jgi:uncharacterized protein (TIGR02266 family)